MNMKPIISSLVLGYIVQSFRATHTHTRRLTVNNQRANLMATELKFEKLNDKHCEN